MAVYLSCPGCGGLIDSSSAVSEALYCTRCNGYAAKYRERRGAGDYETKDRNDKVREYAK